MENNNVFSVKNLSFSYGEKLILDDISFNIKKGKITTLMGSNGCGKSTLFQLLTKNLTPNSGNIVLKNNDIQRISIKDFAKQVSIVHQYNTTPEDLSVRDLVSYGRTPYTKIATNNKMREINENKIDRAMKITGIYNLKDRNVSSLSGGQKQRVWIAMALAQDTKIIFLDEPTTYLDVRYQLEILKLVKALNEIGKITIVMVLHDINQALTYSDEILALSTKGKILSQGKPTEVITTDLIKKMYGVDLEITQINEKPFVLTV